MNKDIQEIKITLLEIKQLIADNRDEIEKIKLELVRRQGKGTLKVLYPDFDPNEVEEWRCD